jgi:hypothetical protein
MKNIRALFANVQNTYTLTSSYVRSVRKEQYDYRDVAILPDSADISYAMRKFYEDETLRIFGQAQDVWTVTTSETIDAFYFDYVLYSGRVGVVIGKSIDFDDTNNIEYTYTLIMESPIDIFDAFSVV